MSIRKKILGIVDRKFGKTSFALNEIDKKLEKYLKYKNGFFIEAGANDGINQSNTLYFEKYKNWRGLLIEPIPELAIKCKQNRPECIVENCALVSSQYQDKTIELRYADLMSVISGGMKSIDEEDLHIANGLKIQNISETYNINVRARTLSSILDEHSIKDIDLFSLDVEGFELEVLKGLDFKQYKPKLLLIETSYRDEIEAFIGGLYEIVDELSHHDVLYKLKNVH